jgi:hypothetical protein
MSGLEEFALRCEQATGADRELDCAIAVGLGLAEVIELRGAPAWATRNSDGGLNIPGNAPDMLVKDYTASLDAAMTLVPEGGDGWGWAIRYYSELSRKAHGEVWERDNADPTEGDYHRSAAAAPALALCAAALRARAHLNHSGTGKGRD